MLFQRRVQLYDQNSDGIFIPCSVNGVGRETVRPDGNKSDRTHRGERKNQQQKKLGNSKEKGIEEEQGTDAEQIYGTVRKEKGVKSPWEK